MSRSRMSDQTNKRKSVRAWTLVGSLSAVLVISIAALCPLGAQEQGRTEGPPPFAVGKVYQFAKITDGIYYATSRTPSVMQTGSNDPIIVTDRDVMIVDDGMTAAAGGALLEDVKLLTDKPVRWVVDSHYHYDHTSGNSAFGPDVNIVGQEYVRWALLNRDWQHQDPYVGAEGRATAQINRLTQQIASEQDPDHKAQLQKRLEIAQSDQADLERLKTIKPTPPNITFSSKMTLYDGQREIQLLFLGPGHTMGDTVVYLPKEKIVCTGDLMEGFAEGPRVQYLGDAMFDEWITTLEALKKLDFDTVLPGHGGPFHDKAYITETQQYLKDFMTQAEALRKQGLTPEEAAPKVDMTSLKSVFPFNQIKGPGVDVRGVRRLYEYLDERAKGTTAQ